MILLNILYFEIKFLCRGLYIKFKMLNNKYDIKLINYSKIYFSGDSCFCQIFLKIIFNEKDQFNIKVFMKLLKIIGLKWFISIVLLFLYLVFDER